MTSHESEKILPLKPSKRFLQEITSLLSGARLPQYPAKVPRQTVDWLFRQGLIVLSRQNAERAEEFIGSGTT
jgi:hypothetical protein